MAFHLLVVEDELELARSLARRLPQLIDACVVDIASSGLAALSKLEQRHYNACLVDWVMPGLCGEELLIRARSVRRSTPLVVYSGQMDVETTVAAMRAGASDVVTKSTASELLAEKLLSVCKPAAINSKSWLAAATACAGLVGESLAIQSLRDEIQRVARFPDVPILICGETGTGKELVAQCLHELSRPRQPLVPINCAALPEGLFEGELFGHAKGAFTTAANARAGLLETVGSGTLFLDEVGDLPTSVQPKLLRVLEDHKYRPLGANQEKAFRGRLVAATHRPLLGQRSAFRSDLYYRLAGYSINIPPLRERLNDVRPLAEFFLERFCSNHGGLSKRMLPEAFAILEQHHWPGNVRELKRAVEGAAIATDADTIDAGVLAPLLHQVSVPPRSREVGLVDSQPDPVSGVRAEQAPPSTLRDVERAMILQTFEASGHNVSRAARELGLPRSTLRDKLRRLGVR